MPIQSKLVKEKDLDELFKVTVNGLKARLQDKETCTAADFANALKLLKDQGIEPSIVNDADDPHQVAREILDNLPIYAESN
jgi:polyphosphate kinase